MSVFTVSYQTSFPFDRFVSNANIGYKTISGRSYTNFKVSNILFPKANDPNFPEQNLRLLSALVKVSESFQVGTGCMFRVYDGKVSHDTHRSVGIYQRNVRFSNFDLRPFPLKKKVLIMSHTKIAKIIFLHYYCVSTV